MIRYRASSVSKACTSFLPSAVLRVRGVGGIWVTQSFLHHLNSPKTTRPPILASILLPTFSASCMITKSGATYPEPMFSIFGNCETSYLFSIPLFSKNSTTSSIHWFSFLITVGLRWRDMVLSRCTSANILIFWSTTPSIGLVLIHIKRVRTSRWRPLVRHSAPLNWPMRKVSMV